MHKKFKIPFYIFLAIILLSGFNLPASAQDQPEEKTEAVGLLSDKPAKLVTAIEIIGNKSISSNTILSKMKTRIGSPYQENVVNDDLKRLYLLKFFSDIKIDTQDHKEGLKVIITVVERAVIEKIAFSGIKRLTMKEEEIKKSLKSKETQYLDYPSLTEDAKTLQKLYEKIGYINAKIEHEVEVEEKTNKAKIKFNITENKKVKIKNIFVEGNKNYSRKRILKLIKTRKAWFFNAGVYKEEVLKEDLERIKAFYRKKGFADVLVDYAVKSDTQKPFLYITLKIQEGKRYQVGSVTIKGNQDISEQDILAKTKECRPYQVFSQESLEQDIASIQGLYFDRGYIFAQVQEATSLNPNTQRIDIVFSIRENEIAYVDQIKVRGNIKTKDVVIRRELRIKPADRFDGEKLRRSKERLQNLGFFEEISYDTEDTTVPNRKDLIVEVREAKTGAFSFGGGYSSVDEFMGFIEIEQKNFDWKNFPYFTGDGQNLRLRASAGTLTKGFDLSFTEPWVFDYPVSFGFDAYSRSRERETDAGYGYDEEVQGGDLRVGKEVSEYLRASLMYRYDTIKITDISEDASSELKKEEGKNSVSSMNFGLSFDSRDNVFDPRRGDILSGSVEVAGGPFGGDKDFWKFFGRASHYFPLFTGSVLEFRLRAGLADSYDDSNYLPIYERFFAGGAQTIRGYHERKIGPIDPVTKDPLGGEAMLVGNIEYIYPLYDFIKVAVFFDTGNVWGKVGDFGTDDLKSSFGLGLRLKTPIGPIMLDYGIPLDKEPGELEKGNGRFHFNVSHGF